MTAYQIARIAPRRDPNLLLVKDGQTSAAPATERGTVTMGALRTGMLKESKTTQAPFFRNYVQGKAIVGDRLVCDNLSGWDTYLPALYKGGTLRVMRCTADRIETVAVRKVKDAGIDARRYLHMIDNAPAVLPPEVSSLRWLPPGYWGINGTTGFHFRIRAIAGTRASAWSNVALYKPGARKGELAVDKTGFVAGPQIDTRNYTIDPAIPVPVLSAATDAATQTLTLNWNPQAGYQYLIEWTHDLSWQGDTYLTLEGGMQGIDPADLMIFDRRLPFTAKAELFSPRMQGVSQAGFISRGPSFAENLPAGATLAYMEEAGRPFARITLPAGTSLNLEVYPNGGAKQAWYSVLEKDKVYTARISGRMDRAQTVKVRMRGVESAGDTLKSCVIGTSFGHYDTDFTQIGDAPNDAVARASDFTVTGPAVFDLENFTHFEKALGGPFETDPADVAMVAAARPLYIRQHGAVKSRPMSWALASYLRTEGQGQGGLHLWLRQTRQVQEAAGVPVNPWLQVPGSFSDEDIAGLAEYLCTPFDPAVDTQAAKPWAWLRHNQGQTASWQDVFPAIRIEWENENWNPLSGFWTLPGANGQSPGTVNGKMLDRMARIILSHPDCRKERWNFYLGLWAASGWGAGSWNGDSVRASAHADFAGYANYNGGWDSGLSSPRRADVPRNVFAAIADSVVTDIGTRNRHEQAQDLAAKLAENAAGRAKPILAAHYESGPGYNLNGLNGSVVTAEDVVQQEALMKSVGVGTATLDAFLCNAAGGVVSNDFFTVARGEYWSAAAKTVHGAAPNPPFMWVGFINRHLAGRVALLDLSQQETLSDPYGQTRLRTDMGGLIRAYRVVRADGTRAFAFCNISDSRAATLTVLKKPGGQWTRHWMNGPHTLTNFTPATREAVAIRAEPAPDWSQGSVTLTIGAGLAEVYVEAAAGE